MNARTGALAVLLLQISSGCAHTQGAAHSSTSTWSDDTPSWVESEALQGGQLCGLGVAGAGFDSNSPYPKQLSQERAVLNLAGILGTQVQEAIVDDQTNSGTQVDTAQLLKVDDSLVERVGSVAKTEFWLDAAGSGPYAQKNFTYAHACLTAQDLQGAFKIDPKQFKSAGGSRVVPSQVPTWITQSGKQPGGRMCAVGYSLPAFFADNTFGSVVDDVRGQLAENIQTMVSSYYEEASDGQHDVVEQMTVATTQSLAKGVIVTHFWHDRDGIGPNKHKMTTYGWGCVYPMDVMSQGLSAAHEKVPEAKIAAVRQRAAAAFASVDRMPASSAPAPASASVPGTASGAVAQDAEAGSVH